MEYDVRKGVEDPITSIRVAAINRNYNSADAIEPVSDRIKIKDSDSGTGLIVCSKEHAENLIKGLQKAIDLGWIE